jgi:pyruvate/2-oxoglutarate dehydrogenase complex dihydrolipoamide acyltransferase (E2) component
MPKAASSGPIVTTTLQMPENQEGSAPQSGAEKESVPFWQRLAQISEKDWKERCTLWIYRIGPKVGVVPGAKGYLDVLGGAITPDYIKQRWGGGTFRVMLNYDNRMKACHDEDIAGEPRYDLSKEIPPQQSTPKNEDSSSVRTLLEKLPDTKQVLADSMDMMNTAYKTSLENIAQARAANGGDGGGSDMMKLMLAMMNGQTQILTTLIAAVVKQPSPAAPVDPSATLKTSLELFSALKDFASDNGGGKRASLWENLAERAIDKAPEFIREVRGGVESIGRQRLELEHARRGAPGPPMPAAVPAAATGQPPAPLAVAPPPQPAPPQVTEDEAFERLAARHIVKMIYAGEPADMVMLFLRGANRKTFEMVMELNAAQLREVISADPILSQLLQYPELDAVIADITQFSAEEKAAALAEQDTEAARVQ